MSAAEAEPITTRIGDRDVEIRQTHPDIFNAYDAQTRERLVIVTGQRNGWWFGARIGHPPRLFELEEGGIDEAVQSLIDAP